MIEDREVPWFPTVIHLKLPLYSVNSIDVTEQLQKSISTLGYRVPKDYQFLYAPHGAPNLLFINLIIYNRKILQDQAMKELLLEYMI